MRALLVLSLVFLPVIAGSGAFASAAHAQSSGASSKPSSSAPQPPADDSDSASRPKPKLGIDSLLRPRVVAPRRASAPAVPSEETHGGRNRESWARAFGDARAELREAEAGLEKSRKKLSEASQGGNYTYNPLGGTDSSPTDPEVQKAKAQRDRDRKAIEAAQKRLRDLTVEASLAGVPDEWIPPDSDTSPSAPKSEPSEESTRLQ